MSHEAELKDLETKIAHHERESVRAEARRDALKEELTEALKLAKAEYGVSTLQELETLAKELEEKVEAALADLKEKSDGLE